MGKDRIAQPGASENGNKQEQHNHPREMVSCPYHREPLSEPIAYRDWKRKAGRKSKTTGTFLSQRVEMRGQTCALRLPVSDSAATVTSNRWRSLCSDTLMVSSSARLPCWRAWSATSP